MRKPSTAQTALDNANTVLTVGSRPGLSRRALALVGGAVLMSAMALAPDQAHAANYGDLLNAPSTSANEYGRDEALRTSQGRLAEVVMVRPVELRNNSRVTFGAAVGGALGVASAKDIDNGTARSAARVLLGGLGAAIGQGVQKRVTRQDAVQITVMERGNNGRTKLTNVVQEADLPVRPGDIVMLDGRGSKVRVIPLDPQFQARLRGQQSPQQAPSRYRPR